MKELYTQLDGQQAYMLVISTMIWGQSTTEAACLSQIFSEALIQVERKHHGTLEQFLRAFLEETVHHPPMKRVMDEVITEMVNAGYVVPMEPKMTGGGEND